MKKENMKKTMTNVLQKIVLCSSKIDRRKQYEEI